MELYAPILVLAVLAAGFAIFSVTIAPFTGFPFGSVIVPVSS